MSKTSIAGLIFLYILLSLIIPWYGFNCPAPGPNTCSELVGGLLISPLAAIIVIVIGIVMYIARNKEK